ncbi:MAG: c-type cytochrome [Pseudomonadota bacterium]
MRTLTLAALLLAAVGAYADAAPADNYERYCALCHGGDRTGYKNDHAPSLVSETLFDAGPMVPYMAISYGRPGTPMGPYLDEVGGPMSDVEIRELTMWLVQQAGHPPKPPSDIGLVPIRGDAELGSKLYAEQCASCHGASGEGGEGTALGNPTMLATTPDSFLKATIERGRAGTPMEAYGERLSEAEIDGIVTFLRSRAQGWDVEAMEFAEPPSLDNIILNPDGEAPEFTLSDDRYVMAKDLNAALEAGKRMILIDTRVPYFWAMAHIKGSVPVPYYSSREELVNALPQDGTWIVAYCECPRAAADSAVTALRGIGYKNTAVLYEGYAGWSALGYPIAAGRIEPETVSRND